MFATESRQNTVMVIEDDEDTRVLTVEVLESEGFKAFGVEDGDLASKFLQQKVLPDYIMMDISIPGTPTMELMNILNARQDRQETKVIIISGWDDIDKKSKLMKADDFLKKPVDLDKLIKILHK